ncbi:MAG: glycosyltransferase family 9 protein [Ignavibacteria bacterium]|nr:glycosyltransferase family 9 protein [Ignavibacteria bacterium]
MVVPPKHFLVAQTIFLGDVVLTIPLLQHLKHAYPEAKIDVIVSKEMEKLLICHPCVSSVLTYDKNGEDKGWSGILKTARRLASNKYSLALVLPGSVRTALAVYLARIPRRIGTDQSNGLLLFADKLKFRRELRSSPHGRSVVFLDRTWKALGGRGSFISPLFTDVVRLVPNHHATLRHLQLLEPLGIPLREELLQPQVYPSKRDIDVIDQLLIEVETQKLIAVAPGSTWATKRWPARKYEASIKQFVQEGYVIVLIGGRSDSELCASIGRKLGPKSLVDSSGKLTPLQSAELLKRCRVLLTNDSAPMHLAASVGTPVVALFGPTVPEFGFSPVGGNHVIVERKSLWCRPCTPHGGERCPIGTHECMNEISEEEVSQAVSKLLGPARAK